MIVAKVGGSLYDWPELGSALRQWHAEQTEEVLLFPGGGEAADAVRAWDRVHNLGEEESHWLAIRALSLGAQLLKRLLPELPIVTAPEPGIFDPFPFFLANPGPPHDWRVTTDSLAATVAQAAKATQLILLKSENPPEITTWAETGYVDSYFPIAIAGATFGISARNLPARKSEKI